jgi:hypothetical protein
MELEVPAERHHRNMFLFLGDYVERRTSFFSLQFLFQKLLELSKSPANTRSPISYGFSASILQNIASIIRD